MAAFLPNTSMKTGTAAIHFTIRNLWRHKPCLFILIHFHIIFYSKDYILFPFSQIYLRTMIIIHQKTLSKGMFDIQMIMFHRIIQTPNNLNDRSLY